MPRYQWQTSACDRVVDTETGMIYDWPIRLSDPPLPEDVELMDKISAEIPQMQIPQSTPIDTKALRASDAVRRMNEKDKLSERAIRSILLALVRDGTVNVEDVRALMQDEEDVKAIREERRNILSEDSQ